MKTTIFLMRHGETETNKDNMLCGHTDVDLSKRGYKQAELGAEFLSKYKFDKIYSSDLRRALNTVTPIAKKQGLEINKEKNLREIFCGDWEARKGVELLKAYPEEYGKYLNDFINCKCVNGESGKELVERAVKTVTKIAEENIGKTILIATHGGILRALDGYLFTNKGWQAFSWYSNVGISIAEYEDGEWKLIKRNVADYLGELKTDLDVTQV